MESLVKNAADKKQVLSATEKEARARERELDDFRFLLQSVQGRRVLWRLLSECKVFGSVWHQSALIHYNSGRQDFGHFLLAEITEANPDAFLQMMKEGKQLEGEKRIL